MAKAVNQAEKMTIGNIELSRGVFQDQTGWILDIDWYLNDKWKKSEKTFFETSALLKGYISGLDMD